MSNAQCAVPLTGQPEHCNVYYVSNQDLEVAGGIDNTDTKIRRRRGAGRRGCRGGQRHKKKPSCESPETCDLAETTTQETVEGLNQNDREYSWKTPEEIYQAGDTISVLIVKDEQPAVSDTTTPKLPVPLSSLQTPPRSLPDAVKSRYGVVDADNDNNDSNSVRSSGHGESYSHGGDSSESNGTLDDSESKTCSNGDDDESGSCRKKEILMPKMAKREARFVVPPPRPFNVGPRPLSSPWRRDENSNETCEKIYDVEHGDLEAAASTAAGASVQANKMDSEVLGRKRPRQWLLDQTWRRADGPWRVAETEALGRSLKAELVGKQDTNEFAVQTPAMQVDEAGNEGGESCIVEGDERAEQAVKEKQTEQREAERVQEEQGQEEQNGKDWDREDKGREGQGRTKNAVTEEQAKWQCKVDEDAQLTSGQVEWREQQRLSAYWKTVRAQQDMVEAAAEQARAAEAEERAAAKRARAVEENRVRGERFALDVGFLLDMVERDPDVVTQLHSQARDALQARLDNPNVAILGILRSFFDYFPHISDMALFAWLCEEPRHPVLFPTYTFMRSGFMAKWQDRRRKKQQQQPLAPSVANTGQQPETQEPQPPTATHSTLQPQALPFVPEVGTQPPPSRTAGHTSGRGGRRERGERGGRGIRGGRGGRGGRTSSLTNSRMNESPDQKNRSQWLRLNWWSYAYYLQVVWQRRQAEVDALFDVFLRMRNRWRQVRQMRRESTRAVVGEEVWQRTQAQRRMAGFLDYEYWPGDELVRCECDECNGEDGNIDEERMTVTRYDNIG